MGAREYSRRRWECKASNSTCKCAYLQNTRILTRRRQNPTTFATDGRMDLTGTIRLGNGNEYGRDAYEGDHRARATASAECMYKIGQLDIGVNPFVRLLCLRHSLSPTD